MTTLASTRLAPGPRGYPFVGVWPQLRRNPLRFLLEAARGFGDVVSLDLGIHRIYLINHPAHIRDILQDHHHNYRKGPSAGRVRPLFGEGLTTSDGEAWRHQRRLMLPVFHHKRILALAPVITEATQEMLERWRPVAERGQPLDIAREMMTLTRTIITRLLFGHALGREVVAALGEALTIVLDETNRRLWTFITPPAFLPTSRNRRLHHALDTLDAIVHRAIEERRPGSGAEADGLLSLLLALRDEETGEPMADALLRDEVMTLLIAGHTTVAAALAWIWIVLSRHPAEARTLRGELRTTPGDRLGGQEVPALTYTRLVIDEVLRLYPPTWVTARSPIEDDVIGGYPIPSGSVVLLSPYVMHRHPGFWDDPERFDPGRFTPERADGRPREAYFPFGAGPRACIGQGLALMELEMIVAMVARAYRLRLLPDQEVTAVPALTLRPPQPTLMIPYQDAVVPG